MNIKDVENLAVLARLQMSEEEQLAILKDMESIIEYVKQVESVSVSGVEPKYDVFNVWREDEVSERDFSKDLIKEQFPDSKGGFLKVKKIL